MKTLLESLNFKKVIGLFGIEIETEGKNLPRFDSVYWRSEVDASLRGESLEYVLKKPMEVSSIIKAVDELNKKAEVFNTKWNFSFRTSTHVHMNIQHNTHTELLNILYTYYLLENPLVSYCGESRKNNRFCLRIEDADGCLVTLSNIFKGDEKELIQIPQDRVRYSSLNLEAIKKYGSIEFRSMRGTVDKKEIKTWLDLLVNVREYALSKKSPIEIYNSFVEKGAEEFAKDVLKDAFAEVNYPDLAQDVNRSFSLTIELPFAYKNKNEKKEEPNIKFAIKDLGKELVNEINDPFPNPFLEAQGPVGLQRRVRVRV